MGSCKFKKYIYAAELSMINILKHTYSIKDIQKRFLKIKKPEEYRRILQDLNIIFVTH